MFSYISSVSVAEILHFDALGIQGSHLGVNWGSLQPNLAAAVALTPPRWNSPIPAGKSSRFPDPDRFILPKIFLMPLFLLNVNGGELGEFSFDDVTSPEAFSVSAANWRFFYYLASEWNIRTYKLQLLNPLVPKTFFSTIFRNRNVINFYCVKSALFYISYKCTYTFLLNAFERKPHFSKVLWKARKYKDLLRFYDPKRHLSALDENLGTFQSSILLSCSIDSQILTFPHHLDGKIRFLMKSLRFKTRRIFYCRLQSGQM